MFQILGLILPLFAVIGLGRLASKRRYLDEHGVAAINGFTYWIALPCLLFGSMAESEAQNVIEVALIYLLCCLGVFALAIAVCYAAIGRSLARAAMFALNSSYGAVIFLGTPLVAAFYGPEGVSVMLAIIVFHTGILLPLAAMLIELGNHRQGGVQAAAVNTVKGLLHNPIIAAIFTGALWRLSGLPLPMPVHRFLMLLGPAASPLALFCLGALLPSADTRWGVMREAVLATALKLLVLPLCVGTACWLASIRGVPWQVAVLTAALPTGANAFLLARRATGYAQASASIVVATSVVGIGTITMLLDFIR